MLNISLKDVMTQGYLYVEERQFTGKALGVMRDMHISCVFVMRNNTPTGIITERRIMGRALTGINLYTAPVTEIMSRPLLSLTPENTIQEACDFMTKHEIRHLGIVDAYGNLKGTVTPGNIVNLMGTESFSSTALVKDVMHTNLVFEEESSTLKEAAAAIILQKTCCAIVMNNGYPVGVVSEKDVARCLGYGQDISGIRLNKIMSTPVIGVEETDTIAQGLITLRKHHIHRVLVYNKEGKVSGILALGGLVENIQKVLS